VSSAGEVSRAAFGGPVRRAPASAWRIRLPRGLGARSPLRVARGLRAGGRRPRDGDEAAKTVPRWTLSSPKGGRPAARELALGERDGGLGRQGSTTGCSLASTSYAHRRAACSWTSSRGARSSTGDSRSETRRGSSWTSSRPGRPRRCRSRRRAARPCSWSRRRGARISDPLVVSGYSRNFEAANTITLTDTTGEVVARRTVLGNDWSSTWGYFRGHPRPAPVLGQGDPEGRDRERPRGLLRGGRDPRKRELVRGMRGRRSSTRG
jgi:hypothetical protein